MLVALLVGALAAAGSAAPGTPGPQPSLFGINTGTFDKSNARYALDTPNAKKLGARWVHFTGDSMRFAAGKPNFKIQDSLVNQALREHLGVLLSLGTDPGACAAVLTHCPPTNLTAYDGYLKNVLLHYRGRVQWFESWVEPNHASMWAPAPDPTAYAQLLGNEYTVFQQVNARYGMDDKLLFAGIGGSDLGYLDQVLTALGGKKPFDAVAHHAYRFPPDDPATPNYAISFPGGGHPKLTWVQELTDYENEFTSHGYGTPDMWLTEFGWPGASVADGCGGDTSTEQDQATFLNEAYQDLGQLTFVKAAFYFNLRDYLTGVANPDPTCFAHYGLMTTSFKLKPAGRVFKAAAHSAGGRSGPDRARETAPPGP